MVQVTELGYFGVGVSDLEAWKRFAREILALEVVDEGETDRCHLRSGLLASPHRSARRWQRRSRLSRLPRRGPRGIRRDAEAARERGHRRARRFARRGRGATRARGDEARGSRRQPDRNLSRTARSLQQAVSSGPRDARQVRDRQRRRRALHHPPARFGGRRALLSGARDARRRRIQVRIRCEGAAAALHALRHTRSLGGLGPRRFRQAPQSHHARGGQPRRRRAHARSRAQGEDSGQHAAREALERPHVLVLLPQPVGLSDRVRVRARATRRINPSTTTPTSMATRPKPVGSEPSHQGEFR